MYTCNTVNFVMIIYKYSVNINTPLILKSSNLIIIIIGNSRSL